MSRLLASLLVLGLASCTANGVTSAEPAPQATPASVTLDDLRAEIAEVASLQRDADRRIGAVLVAVRDLDAIIGRFRDPETVDDARAAWSDVDARAAAVVVDGLRDPFFELAHAVDRARQTLAGMRAVLVDDGGDDPSGAWALDYIEAEDAVLVAVREYAEDADRLARALITHWATYEEISEETSVFVEQRWYYRTSQEAADAYELTIQSKLPLLQVAQGDIADAIVTREDAAEAVSEAVAEARSAWVARPAPVTSPSPAP
jgi:hypothetical protein